MSGITDFVCWVVAISLATAFVLSLGRKWELLEWAQVHAPSDLVHEALSCKFCLSWWASLAVSILVALVAWEWWILLCPFCTTCIVRELW